MSVEEELTALRRICLRAELVDEGDGPLVYLPDFKVQHGVEVVTVDALLAPRQHTGYTTRLYLSQPFLDRGANWTTHQVIGRGWHTMSYNDVPASLPWIEILANHLSQLR